MDYEIWQQLLSLESRDITQQWHKKIHGRELNVRRAKEINSAAKQAREYFRNANSSNYSVRPLLTFYGVASLSRALLLLLKANGGEEGLSKGHGLETVGWSDILSAGDSSLGLAQLGSLKIKTCSGLFSDFLKETNNRISMHINSSAVDWHLNYNIPSHGNSFSLIELFSRIPDLQKDYINVSTEIKYSNIQEMSYSLEKGFRAKVNKSTFINFKQSYLDLGYNVECDDKWCDITSGAENFSEKLPLFIHAYIQKNFGPIPDLFIAQPLENNSNYSQLCITYMVSYFLGMLVRYYPTHWMSLIQGDKGDALWPTINRAQQFVEISYPELVIELIYDVIKKSKVREQI